MWRTLLGYAFKALLVAAAVGACWYVVDLVAGAFRDRAALTDKLQAAAVENDRTKAEREDARHQAAAVAQFTASELKARDDASKTAAARAAKIQKELTHAKSRIADWQTSADPELARCLRMPVPRWLLDGTDEAGPAAAEPGAILRGPAPGSGGARPH